MPKLFVFLLLIFQPILAHPVLPHEFYVFTNASQPYIVRSRATNKSMIAYPASIGSSGMASRISMNSGISSKNADLLVGEKGLPDGVWKDKEVSKMSNRMASMADGNASRGGSTDDKARFATTNLPMINQENKDSTMSPSTSTDQSPNANGSPRTPSMIAFPSLLTPKGTSKIGKDPLATTNLPMVNQENFNNDGTSTMDPLNEMIAPTDHNDPIAFRPLVSPEGITFPTRLPSDKLERTKTDGSLVDSEGIPMSTAIKNYIMRSPKNGTLDSYDFAVQAMIDAIMGAEEDSGSWSSEEEESHAEA